MDPDVKTSGYRYILVAPCKRSAARGLEIGVAVVAGYNNGGELGEIKVSIPH